MVDPRVLADLAELRDALQAIYFQAGEFYCRSAPDDPGGYGYTNHFSVYVRGLFGITFAIHPAEHVFEFIDCELLGGECLDSTRETMGGII